MIQSLKIGQLLTEEQVTEATDQAWNRTETTTTTTEPVLRRHAKWLLLTLALIPLGMQFFEIPSEPRTDLWSALLDSRNLVAYPLILAPVISAAFFWVINKFGWKGIKKYFFGSSHEEEEFSVLSFFFEKVQGKTERKHIKSPADSISEFRGIFSHLVDTVHTQNSQLRFVIVVDNIDRIPPDRARDFWSTMQTFFGESGGLRKPQSMKYWLIAPFSVEALSFVFRDNLPDRHVVTIPPDSDLEEAQLPKSDDPITKARAYVDKTFGLVFFVPPPILANWRKYLLDQLIRAFPEHDENDRIEIQSLFDFARSSSNSTITPRELKLFVNGLVVLYRQRGNEIPLSAMAAYILHKDRIVGTEIPDDFLTGPELRMIDDPQWRSMIAALHFGVSPNEADQVLLREPILHALREGAAEKLKEVENRHGFLDVLPKVVLEELDKPQRGDGAALAQMAATIEALEGGSSLVLHTVWRSMRVHLRSVTHWDGFQKSPADGIKAILAHTPALSRSQVCIAASQSLSRAEVPSLEGHFHTANPSAANWLSAAQVVVGAASDPLSVTISIPGTPNFKLEVLQQLAELEPSAAARMAIAPNMSGEELSTVIAVELAAGHYLRAPATFVSFVSDIVKLEINWTEITTAGSNQLRVTGINADECRSLTMLLTSIATIAQFAEAATALKELSLQGHLSHLLHQHNKKMDTRAVLIGAILLVNPAFERAGQTENSEQGDAIFNKTISASQFDEKLVASIANFIRSMRAVARLFRNGVKNSNIARFVAAVISSVAESGFEFDIEPQLVIDHLDFLVEHEDLITTKDFVSHLATRKNLLDLLSAQPFEVSRCHLYGSTLEVAEAFEDAKYLDFLERGILALDKAEWEQAMRSPSGQHDDLVNLCLGLRTLHPGFDLSTSTRDALLAHIRKVGKGEIDVSNEARKQLATILSLLNAALLTSLMRDVVDDMVGSADKALIDRVIELVGDHIDLSEESDVDRIVRRIFTPLVDEPAEHTADWMRRVVERRPDFFRQLPAQNKQEFGSRVRDALNMNESLSLETAASLKKTAEILNLDLDADDHKDDGAANNDSDT